MSCTIRKAATNDAPALYPLIRQLGYDIGITELEKNILLHDTDNYLLLVAEDKAKLSAFISILFYRYLHVDRELARITAFCVDEQYRNSGIGSQLLKHTEEIIRQRNCQLIELASNDKRVDAHRFYERHGYLERRKRYVKYL